MRGLKTCPRAAAAATLKRSVGIQNPYFAMEANPHFPSLRNLACQCFALSSSLFPGSACSPLPIHIYCVELFSQNSNLVNCFCTIFSSSFNNCGKIHFLTGFCALVDETRSILYSNEDLWQQVWTTYKRFNRINDLSFAALLNLPFDSATSESAVVSPQGKISQSTPNRKAPAPAAKKAAAKKPMNPFALLAADGDDEDDDSDKSSDEESNEVVAAPVKQSPKPSARPTKIDAIESPFAIRHLDLCDLAFIRESLITKCVFSNFVFSLFWSLIVSWLIRAILTHGSRITSLNLGRCYQITMDTARAIKNAHVPLSKLVYAQRWSSYFLMSDSQVFLSLLL
jgi:hypothetical protein